MYFDAWISSQQANISVDGLRIIWEKKNQRSRKTDKEPRKDIQRNSKKQTVAYEQRNE